MLVRMPMVGERWRASSNWKLLTSNTISSGSPAFASMRSAKARPKLKPIFPAKTQSFSPLMMWWQRVAVVVLPLLPVTATMGAKNEYYVFGQYFNKGGWHTPDIIKTGPDGIEMDKLKIRYTNADGFKVFNEIEYDGEAYYLEEDSTGKSSSFYVEKGNNL